jgi:hypothetical protein
MVVSVAGVSWSFLALFGILHEMIHPGERIWSASRTFGPALTPLSSFIASIPLALFLANWMVWCIPPARRALNLEAAPGTTFLESQKQLLQAARYLVPIALLLGFIGAVLPWN